MYFVYFVLPGVGSKFLLRPSTFDDNGITSTDVVYPLDSTLLDTMVFLHLFIVNKSGGLIHHRPLSPKAPKIGTNEWLRIGSTFHSLHAIAAEASPVRLPNGKNNCM
jgi:hypothetical protein